MKKQILICTILLAAAAARGYGRPPADIVPKPLSVVEKDGYFTMKSPCTVTVPAANPRLAVQAEVFAGYMEELTGSRAAVKTSATRKGAVNLSVDKSLAAEQYRLDITPRQVDIAGGSSSGVFYGLQSLRQLATQAFLQKDDKGRLRIGSVSIDDKPSFAYRGGMLDVGRHFFPVADVKAFIDILAMHKINRFHWHLTEDGGWRIEIRKYPKLTEIGSYRPGTVIGHPRDKKGLDGKPHFGFYTQDEIRDVVTYASERSITIIPEIDLPGHTQALLASYPEAGCTGGPYEVMTSWRVSKDVLCIGNEDNFGMLEGILEEVLALFPSEYIHIGGDECPADRWKQCPKCQARMQHEGLKDAHALQGYMTARLDAWLGARGRKLMGWDEILEGGASKTALVQAWRGAESGKKAARSGNYVMMSPAQYCYLDYYQSEDKEKEPLSIGNFLPVEKVYSLDPCADLTPEESKYILGVQGNVWTEFIKTFDHVQYMMLPRMAAIAEIGWSYGRQNYGDFCRRMEGLARVYDLYGYRYGRHMFAPKAQNR